jgi:rhomboid protease GluP
MCPGCRALLEPGAAACPYCGWNVEQTEIRRKGGPVERVLRPFGGLIPSLIFANVLLAAVTVLVQVRMARQFMGPPRSPVDLVIDGILSPRQQVLTRMGANIPEAVLQGAWWRLLCPVFLHGGLLHIFMNMYSLRSIGGLVEEAFGAGKALALYLLAGVAGNLASVAWVHWHGSLVDADGHVILIPRIGASGAILGYAGILAGLGLRIGGPHGKALWMPMVKSVGLILALGLFLSYSGGAFQFDNLAHAGGFALGLVAGLACSFGIRARGTTAVKAWDAAAVALSLLTVAAFVPPALDVVAALR